jgi:prepilin peptidase CpaA
MIPDQPEVGAAMAVVYTIVFALFPIGLAFAAVSDLLTMTISNRLTLGLAATFLAAAPVSGMDLSTFGLHLAVGGAVLAVAFFCFAMGWVGGGDAKLAAAIALWLGPFATVGFLLLASIFGGVLTLVLLIFRRQVWPAFIVGQPWIHRLHDQKAGVPYGVALAAAGFAIYPQTIWMQMAAG